MRNQPPPPVTNVLNERIYAQQEDGTISGHPPGNASATKFVVNLTDVATLDLIRYASQLSKEMFPDTVSVGENELH